MSAPADAQSCATLSDSRVALVCRGYEQAEQQILTSCRPPDNIAPQLRATYCSELLAQARAKRAALFPQGSRPAVTQPPIARPALRARGGLQPLPVTSAPEKPPVLRGFYIGMPANEALAAAALALAPWPGVYTTSSRGNLIDVLLERGPKDAWSIERCVNLPLGWGGKPESEDECSRDSDVLQFEFELDSRTNLVSRVSINSTYVLKSHGYNLEQSQLSFDDFAKLIGKRLGAPVRFGKEDNPTTNCSSSVGDIFTPGTTTCKTNKNESRWYDIDNVAVCKCSMTIYAPGRIYLVPVKAAPNADAIR